MAAYRAGGVRLVAADRVRRVRGRPVSRPTRSCAISGKNIGESPACPGVISVTSGSPLPSTSWWIFVDRPPRERPMP